ncbi:MAG: peptidase S8, partial [Flavobacteriales bacterium]|nr:peptidase S8 [Flavobacteriales bacterium]
MKKLLKVRLLLSWGLFSLSLSFAQPQPGWMLMDAEKDGVHGISEEKAYQLLANRKPRKVVVAVIDSGVDIYHEDLKDVIWTNPGEIPDNGIDDDHNGYIDDIHGWNFIGGKDGSHVNQDSYEITRLYVQLKKKYAGKSVDQIAKKDKKEFALFEAVKKQIDEKLAGNKAESEAIQGLYDNFKSTHEYLASKFNLTDINPTSISSLTIED